MHWVAACLATFVLLMGLAAPAVGQVVVNFPDPNLEAVIRDAIPKPTGPIYDTDLATLTTLLGDHAAISDLTGLEYCTNLTQPSLWDNLITDISPLAGLSNLTQRYLPDNQISDISPLADLENLVGLHLADNPIGDIGELAGLTSLS
jgi:internalin A